MQQVRNLLAREVIDSRGDLTLEVECHLSDGCMGRFIVPSGISKGRFEAVALYDNNKQKTLSCAKHNVTERVLPKLLGEKVFNQQELDALLVECDGTNDKSSLGANVTLGVSLAFAVATAHSKGIPLYQHISNMADIRPLMPRAFVNVINGGAHASNNLAFQEFMLVPSSELSFCKGIMMIREIFIALRSLLKENGYGLGVGDEGGFAPDLYSETDALDLLSSAAKNGGYRLGQDVHIALDVAANHFYRNGYYLLNGKEITSRELVNHYGALISRYNIISIEDPLAEEDREGWQMMTNILGGKAQIVGDDIFVTNSALLRQGIDQNIANAILIKPNQIGTLTETISTVKLAIDGGYNYMVSHRSGDSEDITIAHIAVGLAGGQIKSGSVCRSERTAKYNELLRIEEGFKTFPKLS